MEGTILESEYSAINTRNIKLSSKETFILEGCLWWSFQDVNREHTGKQRLCSSKVKKLCTKHT